MSVMILDAGNSTIKAKIARREFVELALPHALQPLTENEYTTILARASITSSILDYLRINGKTYVIGESAERHGLVTQRNGAARYTRDDFGVFSCSCSGSSVERGQEVRLFSSHPPSDVKFREDFMQAVIGDWAVEVGGSELNFRVTYANTFDEQVGGLMNVLLTEDGQYYQRTDINDGRALVSDIGDFTTDWIAVDPAGEVDYRYSQGFGTGRPNICPHLLPPWGRFGGVGGHDPWRPLSRLSIHSIEVAARGAAPKSLSIGDPVERVGFRRSFTPAAEAAAAKLRQRLLAVACPHLAP